MMNRMSDFRRWLRWHEGSIAVILLLAAMALIVFMGRGFSQGYPLPKHGQCPSGYTTSGSYCAPMNDEKPRAIPKIGQCPANWVQSGNYCLEIRRLNNQLPRLTHSSVSDLTDAVANLLN